MPISLTYIFGIALTALCGWLGVEASQSDIQATSTVLGAIVLGLGVLFNRWRAGGITWYGTRETTEGR